MTSPVSRTAAERAANMAARNEARSAALRNAAALLLSLASTAALSGAPDTAHPSTNNPLFQDLQRIAAPYGIDVAPMRNVRFLGTTDFHLHEDATDFPIFCREPQSLDVLLVGDSTMSWGVIPSVVSQVSGLRVGMFAFRSMYLNTRSLKVVRRVRDAYLKPDGLTVFGYDLWTQGMDPGSFRRTELLRLEAMNDAAFRAFTTRRRQECAPPTAQPTARPERTAPNGPSLQAVQFVRWDSETFTLIGPFRPGSIHSHLPAYERTPISLHQQTSAKSVRDFPGRKAFLISFYTTHDPYRRQRAFYESLYRDNLELIDLGKMHPVDRHFPMDDANHPANTAGIEKSILIGRWLREHGRQ